MTNAIEISLLAEQMKDAYSADGFIMANRNLARLIGLVETTIYAQLITLQKHYSMTNELTDDGYFYATIETLELYTTIKKDAQNRALKNLERKWGLIQTKKMGVPAKRYFTITDKLPAVLVDAKRLEIETSSRLKEVVNQRKEQWKTFKENHVSGIPKRVDIKDISEDKDEKTLCFQHVSGFPKRTFRISRNVHFGNPETINKDLINKDLNKKELKDQSIRLSKIESNTVIAAIEKNKKMTDRLTEIETVYLAVKDQENYSDPLFIETLEKAIHAKINVPFERYLMAAITNNLQENKNQKKNDVPEYIANQPKYKSSELSDEQKQQAEELLRALGELSND